MTTIAFDGKSVAFDTQSTCGGRISHVDDKVVEIQNYGIVYAGGSGELDSVHAFQDWVAGGMKPDDYPDLCKERADNSCFILINYKGELQEFERRPHPVATVVGRDALGSGSDYALGAMAAGKSAEEAVRIAMEYDAYTGGEVIVFDMPSVHEVIY